MKIFFSYLFLLVLVLVLAYTWRKNKIASYEEHAEKVSWQFCEEDDECEIYPKGPCGNIKSINKGYRDAYEHYLSDKIFQCMLGSFYHSHKHSIPDLTQEEGNPPDLSKFKPACLEGKCVIIRK